MNHDSMIVGYCNPHKGLGELGHPEKKLMRAQPSMTKPGTFRYPTHRDVPIVNHRMNLKYQEEEE